LASSSSLLPSSFGASPVPHHRLNDVRAAHSTTAHDCLMSPIPRCSPACREKPRRRVCSSRNRTQPRSLGNHERKHHVAPTRKTARRRGPSCACRGPEVPALAGPDRWWRRRRMT
jgi:hypothetical protein